MTGGFGHVGHYDFWFFSAVAMFGVGCIGGAILTLSTWFLWRRRAVAVGPVLVDLNKLVVDRVVLNGALTVLLLLECATLLWDSLTGCEHFPVEIRWPIDLLLVTAVCVSAIRLLRLYLVSYAEAKRVTSGD